jgi:L-ribulose-5-phosphate 3-epimerase
MKIGINRWTFPGHLSLNECFAQAKHAGFDSIEINIAEDGEVTPASTEAEIQAIVTSSKAAGVEISSLSTGLGWRYPITSPDESVRQKGEENIRAQLKVAQWLGVDTILVVPGIVSADIAYDEAYTRAQAVLKRVAAEAEERKVAVGVENVWNKFLLSPLEFARFLDEIGSPYVGAYFDVGNVLVYGFPDQWIRILGRRIKKIHVKDFKTNIGNITGFCNPLQGDVPWAKVRTALEAIGYNEFITAEVDGYRVHHELGLKHIADSLRIVFQG